MNKASINPKVSNIILNKDDLPWDFRAEPFGEPGQVYKKERSVSVCVYKKYID